MDADLQDNPDEIPELYDLIFKEDFDLISGWKKKRTTTSLQKTFLQNYLMQLPEKLLA